MKKDAHYPSGRANICKACYNLRHKREYSVAQRKAYLRYAATDKGKAARKRATNKYRKTDKGKAAMQRAYVNSILKGN